MTTPYFYIIRHKLTNKRYAGSRWAKNCDPSELLKEDGYFTSSNSIHNLIKHDGLDSFEILKIIELEDPYKYETQFLLENDCANSNEWFNMHNNEKKPEPYGSIGFKTAMLLKYGVEHNTSIPEVKQRMIASAKETYKDNPKMLKDRALKIAESKRKNGTTGKGMPKKHTNNGKTGKWERLEEHKDAISKRQKTQSNFVKNNPMNNQESRTKISESKIGRKRIYREDGTFYMSKVI